MVRTQIYLTEEERSALKALSEASGKSQSELIREAVDELIVQSSEGVKLATLDRAAGLWKKRTDLPEFAEVRRDWDRK